MIEANAYTLQYCLKVMLTDRNCDWSQCLYMAAMLCLKLMFADIKNDREEIFKAKYDGGRQCL